MEQRIKVVTRIKEHGSDKEEFTQIFMVITKEDNIEELIQMKYGGWYDIIDYTIEPVEIFVSNRYCHQVSSKFLEQGC